MNALTYRGPEEGWDRYDEHAPDDDRMPGRPRRRYLTPASAALAALVVGAVGFYAGIRVEKGQATGSSASSATASLASVFAARARTAGGGAGGASATGAGARGGAAGAGFGALGALAGAGGGGGSASFGTVSSVSGRILYLNDSSGNTVKVRLPSSVKVSKSVSVPRKAIRPGDTIVIQGVKNSSGTVVAASVSDSGNASRGPTGSGSTSSSGSKSGSGSGVGSLFSPGGAG